MVIMTGCASATSQLTMGDYNAVISKYSNYIKSNDAEINYQVAEAYRLSNRIKEAEPFYRAALKEGTAEESVSYYYARSLKANQKYEEARKILEKALPNTTDFLISQLIQFEIRGLASLDDMAGSETYFRVKNLDLINTEGAEYAPVYNNEFLYFSSNRDGGKIYKSTGTAFTDIYKVRTKGANIDGRSLVALDPLINDPMINEGSLAIGGNGNYLLFAKGNSGKATGTLEVNIYSTRYRNGNWQQPRPINVNDPNAYDGTPALNDEGNTLYFASNREGGFGGADLYVAQLDRRGRWGDIRNLGPEINTPGNEMFPFISVSGELYFASDGHPGFGNLDLFKATRIGGSMIIENLGEPMNSAADDFGFNEYNLTKGFFSSNRSGGKGDDDIYTFINDDPNLKIINYFLKGTTLTINTAGEEIIVSNTKVDLMSEDGQVIDEFYTGEDGTFRFRVFAEEAYHLRAEKTAYFTTRKEFTTVGKSIKRDTITQFQTDVMFDLNVNLEQIVIEKPVILNNIYYDLDKADIRPDAEPTLDSLVLIMRDNPQIFIELGSHTDARDTEVYNLDLSQRRAKSAVDYLITNGISSDRVIAKGYGESQLIVKEAQTEEAHQINRRTQFQVLKYNPDQMSEEEKDKDPLDEYERFFDKEEGK